MIAANSEQVVPGAAGQAADLTRNHRQRVIEIIERLWLRVYQYLTGGFNPAPFLEKPGREFCRNPERCNWIAPTFFKPVLDLLLRTRSLRHQNEVSQFSKVGRFLAGGAFLSLAPSAVHRSLSSPVVCAGGGNRFRRRDIPARLARGGLRVLPARPKFGSPSRGGLSQRLDYHAEGGNQPFMIGHRKGQGRLFPREDVIRESKLNGKIRQRKSADEICREQEGNHCRQNEI